jgi:hypothetical protein
MPYKKQTEDFQEISENECMRDFLPRDDPEGPLPVKRNQAIDKFLSKIREIQNEGNIRSLEVGHCMQLINKKYGYQTWRHIKWVDFESIKNYIKFNAPKFLDIIDYDFAEKLKNYKPEDDKNLLELEKLCPGIVSNYLQLYMKNKNREQI